MTVVQSFFLGAIQGLTEFLPISSSGHLILFQKLFGLNGDFLFFNLLLHFATLIAVILCFRMQVLDLIKHPFSKKAKMLYISCVPTVIIAFLLKNVVSNVSGAFLGVCFLLTAIVLFVSGSVAKQKNSIFDLNYKSSFLMGVIQGIAVLPGISRSGSTLSVGLLCGGEKEGVAEISFLMSIPVVLGGFVLELVDFCKTQPIFYISPSCMIIGFLSSLVFGILSLRLMLRAVKKLKLFYFSIYLILVAVLTFIFV